MLISGIASCVNAVFRQGVLVAFVRILLLASYLLGVSSIFWGNAGGPVMGLTFIVIIASIVDPWVPANILLYPERGFCERPGFVSRVEPWVMNSFVFACFFLLSAALLYELPWHGVWVFPLPFVAMGLQKLAGVVAKRRRLESAGASARGLEGEPPVRAVVPGMHGEQVV